MAQPLKVLVRFRQRKRTIHKTDICSFIKPLVGMLKVKSNFTEGIKGEEGSLHAPDTNKIMPKFTIDTP